MFEKVVEDLSGVTHSATETHEEVALYALIGTATIGGLSLLFMFWYRGRSIPIHPRLCTGNAFVYVPEFTGTGPGVDVASWR